MDGQFRDASLDKTISPNLSISWFFLIICLWLGLNDIYLVHLIISISKFLVQVFFRKPHFWDFMCLTFLTFLGDAFLEQTSCSSTFYSFSQHIFYCDIWAYVQLFCCRCIRMSWEIHNLLFLALWSVEIFANGLQLLQTTLLGET